MEIILKESKIQFKNPVIGQPTRAIEAHYYARRIVAIVDGVDRQFKFMSNEMPFFVTEEEMIEIIREYVINETPVVEDVTPVETPNTKDETPSVEG